MAGPQLPNLKGTKKETKGYIKGVQDGTRNDLSKPYSGLKKAKFIKDPRTEANV